MGNNQSQELSKRLSIVDSCGTAATRKNNIPYFWKNAKGMNVFDVDGNQIIDCTSCFGVLGIGHTHPFLLEKVHQQLDALTHTMCEITPHEMYVVALEDILDVVGRRSDAQVLLTTSGSEAVEVALKLSYSYTKKPGVISFCGAFHGQTLGALSVTSHNCFRNPFAPLIQNNVTFVPYPNSYRNDYGSEESLINQTLSNLEDIISSGISGVFPVGAIIVEPMQNASGYIIPPAGFFPALRKFCDRHDVLLITDEIFTGFGRTGKWLMTDYENVIADIVCVGKVMGGGLPAAACIAPKSVMSSLDYDGLVPLHGSTFQGNPLSCTAISATIHILKQENLIQQSYINGERLRANLTDIMKNIDVIGDIRGRGSASVIEFVVDKLTKGRNAEAALKFSEFLFSKGIFTLITGVPYGNCVAFCPPFNMSESMIDQVLEACKSYVRQI